MKSIKNILSIAFLALLLQSCFLFDREPVSRTQNEELDKKYRQIQGEWSITGYSINGVDAYDSVIKYKMYYPIRFEYDGAPLDQYGYSKNQNIFYLFEFQDTTISGTNVWDYVGYYQFKTSNNLYFDLHLVYKFSNNIDSVNKKAFVESYRKSVFIRDKNFSCEIISNNEFKLTSTVKLAEIEFNHILTFYRKK